MSAVPAGSQASETGLTRFLARAIARARYADLNAATLAQARLAIADCMACGLAGADTPAVRALAAAMADTAGSCGLWGRGERAAPHAAALINGTAAHVHALDDTNESMRGHPSVAVWPAVAALGEALDAGGEALLLAYCVGVETAAKLGRCVNDRHSRLGWHTTSTLGPIGAAAAGAVLLGLDDVRTAHALGIAASMAGGLRVNFGTMTKALHAGWSAHNGVLAARLAADGVTASEQALEGHEGFIALFRGDEDGKPEAAASWGAPWELEAPGVVIKQYPTCSLQHALIDLVLEARAQRPLDGPGLRLECSISQRLDAMRTQGWPTHGGSAKFSVEYGVAVAALRGTQGIEDFTDEAVRDAAVRAMADRVRVQVGAHLTPGNGDAAELRVFDGQTLVHQARREKPCGHPSHPLSEAAFADKFHALGDPALGAGRARQLLALIRALPSAGARALAQAAAPAG
ncbi:MmgE/PrpD family protein [Achromobacter aloeverae]